MRKNLLFLLCVLSFSFAAQVFAQDDAELKLRLSRTFGYSSGTGDIQGVFTLIVSGPEDLVKVTFYLDGKAIGEATQPPFELRFSTDNYPFGAHMISAVGLTSSGREVKSNELQVRFVTAEEGFQAGMRIALPLLGVAFAAVLFSSLITIIGSGKLKQLPLGAPRHYGAAGGAICVRCGRPFPRHFFSPNMLIGKLERCPFCGKWAIVAAAPLERLRAAEQAELEDAQPVITGPLSDDEAMHKELDDSRYIDL
jgi:hypothetical protein